jgi:hypothetical protein
MFYLVKWPYYDCKVFTYGDNVIYHLANGKLTFYHPISDSWESASRVNILSEAQILDIALVLEGLDVSF